LPLVNGDSVALEQVFANLLQNALKFTPKAGCITLQSEQEGPNIVVSVADTGPGVPADELPNLFGRYRQAADGRQRGGTGLGLFIVKTLVEAHGGTVCATSTLSVGSRFTVQLPTGV
jgi:two-component system sensor histidine kinase BaeS